jgi:hypothetical protein
MNKKKQSVATPKDLTAQIKLDIRQDTPAYYVNYMSVGHTEFDFTISSARVPSTLTSEQEQRVKKEGVLLLETTLQLIVPLSVVKGLIAALANQVQKYEAKHGANPQD